MKMMKTVQDILDLLEANLASDKEELRKHAATLVGPRTRGSTTEHGLEKLPEDRKLSHAYSPHIAGGCDGYKVDGPELKGKVGAIPFGDAQDLGTIKVREGDHGLELFLTPSTLVRSDFADSFDADEIYFIIGDFEGETALFTWHPGPPLGRLEDGINTVTRVKLS